MKYNFSPTSEINLNSCHFILQVIAREALALGIINFVVICGYPEKNAFDLAPIIDNKIPWGDDKQWYLLAGVIITCAKKRGVGILWGGAPNLGYFELVEKEDNYE